MATATLHTPRMGLVHRFKCARIGHYWADDGTGRHCVCVRCGKHEHPVSRHVSYVSQHLQPASLTPDEVLEVPAVASAAEDAGTDGCVASPEPELPPRPAVPAGKAAGVTLAVISLAVLGGATYLAFRHRKRRSH